VRPRACSATPLQKRPTLFRLVMSSQSRARADAGFLLPCQSSIRIQRARSRPSRVSTSLDEPAHYATCVGARDGFIHSTGTARNRSERYIFPAANGASTGLPPARRWSLSWAPGVLLGGIGWRSGAARAEGHAALYGDSLDRDAQA